MRKFIFILVVICILLITEHTERNTVIYYEGRSQNWDISYKIDGNEDSHNSFYTFKYIGTDEILAKNIKYLIDGPREGENGEFTLTNTKEYSDKMKITGGLPSPSDKDIRVTIYWNSKTELLTLKRSKQKLI